MKAMMEPEQADKQPTDSTPWMSFITSGDFEPVMSHLGSTILSVLYKVGLARTERIAETWAYLREGEQLPGALDAVREKPALLIHGEHDEIVPEMGAEFMFRMIWPSAPIVKLPSASHYVQEDAPAWKAA